MLGSARACLSFGAMGLLRTVLILGMLPLGAFFAYRLPRPTGSRWAQIVCLLVYVAVPLPYNALANGRWDAVVLYAAAPLLVAMLARASRVAPFGPDGGAAGPGVRGHAVALPRPGPRLRHRAGGHDRAGGRRRSLVLIGAGLALGGVIAVQPAGRAADAGRVAWSARSSPWCCTCRGPSTSCLPGSTLDVVHRRARTARSRPTWPRCSGSRPGPLGGGAVRVELPRGRRAAAAHRAGGAPHVGGARVDRRHRVVRDRLGSPSAARSTSRSRPSTCSSSRRPSAWRWPPPWAWRRSRSTCPGYRFGWRQIASGPGGGGRRRRASCRCSAPRSTGAGRCRRATTPAPSASSTTRTTRSRSACCGSVTRTRCRSTAGRSTTTSPTPPPTTARPTLENLWVGSDDGRTGLIARRHRPRARRGRRPGSGGCSRRWASATSWCPSGWRRRRSPTTASPCRLASPPRSPASSTSSRSTCRPASPCTGTRRPSRAGRAPVVGGAAHRGRGRRGARRSTCPAPPPCSPTRTGACSWSGDAGGRQHRRSCRRRARTGGSSRSTARRSTRSSRSAGPRASRSATAGTRPCASARRSCATACSLIQAIAWLWVLRVLVRRRFEGANGDGRRPSPARPAVTGGARRRGGGRVRSSRLTALVILGGVIAGGLVLDAADTTTTGDDAGRRSWPVSRCRPPRRPARSRPPGTAPAARPPTTGSPTTS